MAQLWVLVHPGMQSETLSKNKKKKEIFSLYIYYLPSCIFKKDLTLPLSALDLFHSVYILPHHCLLMYCVDFVYTFYLEIEHSTICLYILMLEL